MKKLSKTVEECRQMVEDSRLMLARAKREQHAAEEAVKASKKRVAEARAYLKSLENPD